MVLVTERWPESERTTTLFLSKQNRLISSWLQLWSRLRAVPRQFGRSFLGFLVQHRKVFSHDPLVALVSLSVVQGYHELYELHRSRLETQLLHMTEERDCWIQLTLALAGKVLTKSDLLLKRGIFALVLMGLFMPNYKNL